MYIIYTEIGVSYISFPRALQKHGRVLGKEKYGIVQKIVAESYKNRSDVENARFN